MNKVISINIAGMVFNVDENAYMTLKNYMDALKAHFAHTEGGHEILADIEARMAEMFTERTKNRREVVSAEDVDTVIAALGNPEQMDEGAEPASESNEKYTYTKQSGPRRIYRSPDDKVIGGVCGGIGYYFSIDPLILRLLFVVAFLGFGTGLLLYLILWIIIPEAKTPSEKLQMRGEKVNINNIEKKVKENLNDFKGRVNTWGTEATNTNAAGIRNFFIQLGEGFLRVFKPFLRFVFKAIAILITIISALILIGLVLSLFGATGIIDVTFPQHLNDMFDSRREMTLFMSGLVLIVGAPVIALMYHALRGLLNVRYNNRWVNGALALAWFIGIGVTAYAAINSANRFRAGETLIETLEIETTAGKVLNLDLNVSHSGNSKPYFYHINGKTFSVKNKYESTFTRVTLDIVKSTSGKIELVKEFSAHGKTNDDARMNATSIVYNFTQNDTQLVFDEAFSLQDDSKWRAQDVELTLKIPVGQSVYMQPDLKNIIFDIKNVTDTWDEDMVGHTWQMTNAGLVCTDCPPQTFKKNNRDNDEPEIENTVTALTF